MNTSMNSSLRSAAAASGLLALLLLGAVPAPARAADDGVPVPASLDAKAPVPDDLPARLELPPFTRMSVHAHRKVALPPGYAATEKHLLWSPDLLDAAFESDRKNLQATYHWEGGATTHGYQVGGTVFFVPSLKNPDGVGSLAGVLGFALNRNPLVEGARGRDFPGVDWYGPDHYAGTVQLAGRKAYVFVLNFSRAAGSVEALPIRGDALYLDAKTLLPVLLDGGAFGYVFDYAAAPGLKIDPQGPYLQAMQAGGISPL